jgi:hypothetical protein
MRPDELDENSFVSIRRAHDESVFIPADVEDKAVVADEIDGRSELLLHVRGTIPLGLARDRVPGSERRLGLGVLFPELPQPLPRDDLHGVLIALPNMGNK